MNKKECYIFDFCCFFALLFLVLAVSLRPKVFENQTYENRDYIALYIYKYSHLPSNYISKENDIYLRNKDAIKDGRSFGGDEFRYEGEIVNHTNNTSLAEADYYPSRDKAKQEGRGPYRLIYTTDGKQEIFYTENHYASFTKLTKNKIYLASNIMWMLFIGPYGGVIVIIIRAQTRSNKKETK